MALAYVDDILSAIYFILKIDDPKATVNKILGIYNKFSKVSDLKKMKLNHL